MAYRLKVTRSARKSVRRVAADQLDTAADTLAEADARARPEAVHTARKSIKKTRALLRLTRSDLPRAFYRETMGELRDTGRLLSGSRDATVMAQTVDKLAEELSGQLPARAFRDLRRDVAALAAVDTDDEPIARATARLRELADGVPDWPLDDVRWSTIRKDAARTFARGRKQLAGAGEDPERLHEWRKRVKDCWYHQRLLRDAWPPVMKAYAGEADRLAELLGDDHDLAVLVAFLRGHRDKLAGHAHLDELIVFAEHRREALRADALAIGRRLYAERPGAHRRRTGKLIKAARDRRPAAAAGA